MLRNIFLTKFTNFLNLILAFNWLPVDLKTFLISRLKLNSNMLHRHEDSVMLLSIFITLFALAPFFLSAFHKNNVLNLDLYNNWKTVIYKTRNTGTGNEIRGMQGTQRIFTRIPRNFLEDSRVFYHFNIPCNVREDSGECSERFLEMVKKIPGNVQKDSVECSARSRAMFKKILGNVKKDSGEC